MSKMHLQPPHCDQRVLHAPEDNCEFCNMHPEWQELRRMWGIAFTGHSFDNKGVPHVDEYGNMTLPCPAEYNRGMASVNGWHGNVAHTPEVAKAQEKFFDDLHESLRKGFPEGDWDE